MKGTITLLEQKRLAALTVLLVPGLITYPFLAYANAVPNQSQSVISASPISQIAPTISSNESLGSRITARLTSPIGVDEVKCDRENYSDNKESRGGTISTAIGSSLGFENCIEKASVRDGVAYPKLKNPGLSGYLGFGYERVTNVTRVNDGGDDANGFNTIAGLGYQNRVGNLSYRVGGRLTRQEIDEGDNLDSNQYGVSAGALYTVNKRLSLGLTWSHDEGRLPRNGRGTRDITNSMERNDSNEFDIIGGQINIGSNEDRFQLNLAASYSENEYDLGGNTSSSENAEFLDIRDNDVESYSASLIYNYSPKTQFFVDSHYAEFDYSGSTSTADPTRDSQQYGSSMGIITDLTSKISFSGSIGYTEKDFDSGLRSDQTIADYSASLNYKVTPKTAISVYTASTFEESAFVNGSAIDTELVGVSVNYEVIPSKVYVSAFYNDIDDEYTDSIRNDSGEDYGLSVVYKLTEDLSLNLEASRNTRDSNINEFDFSSESYGLSLNYAFGL